MDRGARPPKLNARISPVDHLGRSISRPLLEDAAAAVSRALRLEMVPNTQRIRDLPCYLFRAFIRRVNRVKRQQLTAEAALVSHVMQAPRSINPTVEIEVHILID